MIDIPDRAYSSALVTPHDHPHLRHDSMMARISLSLICVSALVKICCSSTLVLIQDSLTTRSSHEAPPSSSSANSTYGSAVLFTAWGDHVIQGDIVMTSLYIVTPS